MAWITLDPDKIVITPAERDAVADAATAAGVDDPSATLALALVREIRGRCRGGGITLNTGDTIPDEVEGAALAILRVRLLAFFPEVAARLLDDARKEEAKQAMKTIGDLADGKLGVEKAADPLDDEGDAGGQKVIFKQRTRRMTAGQQNGL